MESLAHQISKLQLRNDPASRRRSSSLPQRKRTSSASSFSMKDDLLNTRSWHSIRQENHHGHSSGCGQTCRGSLIFTVASYNILSQTQLEQHRELYEHLDPRYLTWNHRKQKIFTELIHYQPDVICLQEVDNIHYEDFFKPNLEMNGYESIYKKRTNEKEDGCATFYKSDKFLLEQSVFVEYRRPEIGIMDRDNIGLLIVLRPRNDAQSTNRKLCVANTHLLYNPRRGDIKLGQIMFLLAKIDEVARISTLAVDRQYYPVIICGDFNLQPFSDLYLLLCRGQLQYEGLLQKEMSGQENDWHRGRDYFMEKDFLGFQRLISDQCQLVKRQLQSFESTFGSGIISHSLNLVSTYPHFIHSSTHKREEREVTSKHGLGAVNVDYILYSVADKKNSFVNGRLITRGIREGRLSLIDVLKLISDNDLEELGSLPTRNTSSDHLALLAKFSLR